jgi:hypothetical protein
MLTSRRIAGAIFAALTILLTEPRLASAQDADANEVLRYTLTETGLAKYTEATKKLAALPDEGVDACDDDDAEGASLDEMAARLDALPGAKAAIQSAGMTSREYVLFSMSLLQNAVGAWAASQPGGGLPPGVSKANVDFLQKHDAELKQLEGLTDENDCIDAEAEDEDDD